MSRVHFHSVFVMLLSFLGSITRDSSLNYKLDQAGWADSYLMGLVNQVVSIFVVSQVLVEFVFSFRVNQLSSRFFSFFPK